MKQACDAGILEPNAMTLATATAAGRPSARAVLLKGVDGGGFVFYTNYASRKARELAENPFAALVFTWADLERQVRIEGRASLLSEQEYDDLRQSGQPRLERVSLPVAAINFPEQLVASLRAQRVGTRADDAHVALEHIEQLIVPSFQVLPPHLQVTESPGDVLADHVFSFGVIKL